MTRRSPVRFRSAPRSTRVHIVDRRNRMRLATKPETIIRQVGELSKNHSIPLLEFKDWLIDEEDSMLSNAANYLRVLKLFSNHIGSNIDFKNVTREQVLEFLNQRKNSVEDDPDKKWIRTWNDYLARLIGFYRWLYNQESNRDRSEWIPLNRLTASRKRRTKDIPVIHLVTFGARMNYCWL